MNPPPIQDVFDHLLQRYGHQHWWPAESRLEMMLGAILTQNTAWKNVEKALENLKSAQALELNVLEQTPREQIAEWIRPAGYFNQKSGYIKEMVMSIRGRFEGSLERLFALETADLRSELLSWRGVGPETADSILLYAMEQPTFVVDAYTARLTKRHEWIDPEADYYDIKDFFESSVESNVDLYNEYHALIVRLGKTFCRTKPDCESCPLKDLLPESGPADMRQ